MSAITRRAAFAAVPGIAATVAMPAIAAQPDPLREGVQALVNEIRQELSGNVVLGSVWVLQEAADRLEALPGIQAIPNEHWARWKPDLARYGGRRTLRLAGGAS